MIKTREELREYYMLLTGEYVGYVQMSDSRFKDEHIFKEKKKLPSWEALHKNDIHYILEMTLFDGKTSILIRQHNADFLVVEEELTQEQMQSAESFYTVTPDTPKMKIAQVWEEEENEFCLEDMKVLEAKYLLFAGFEANEGDKL